MKNATLVLMTLALLACGAGQAMAGLVNGSFEDTQGTFVPNFQDTMSLPAGSTTIPGWTTYSAELAWIGPTNPFGITASNGAFSLDLTGYHDSSPYGGVQQSVATIVGDTYLLQFDLGAFGTGAASISASAGGTSSAYSFTAPSGPQVWQQESLTFIATSSNTLISLLGTGASGGGTYIGLDNVTLVDVGPAAVPEPATMTLLGIGIAGMAGYGWRRRKQVVA